MIRLLISLLLFSSGAMAQAIRADIRLTIRNHLPSIKECYTTTLARHPGEFGKIAIDFEVDDKGDVKKSAANQKMTTLKNEELQVCLVNGVKTWKFPPALRGSSYAVNYPFFFRIK